MLHFSHFISTHIDKDDAKYRNIGILSLLTWQASQREILTPENVVYRPLVGLLHHQHYDVLLLLVNNLPITPHTSPQ